MKLIGPITGTAKDDDVKKKKKEPFYIVKYTKDKEMFRTYPELKKAVKAVDARIKELILPNLKKRSIDEIYLQHNIKRGHAEHPTYDFMFTINYDDKKHIVYIKANDLQKLVVRLAQKYCVNNIRCVTADKNVIILFDVPCVCFYRLYYKTIYTLMKRCGLREKRMKRVVSYFSDNLNVDGITQLYDFNSRLVYESLIVISHSEEYDEKIEDGLTRV